MSRLAIFIDGGYLDKLASEDFQLRIDYKKYVAEVVSVIRAGTEGPLDLLRCYYYNCLPYQSDPQPLWRRGNLQQCGAFLKL